jgi:hypothetical protein
MDDARALEVDLEQLADVRGEFVLALERARLRGADPPTIVACLAAAIGEVLGRAGCPDVTPYAFSLVDGAKRAHRATLVELGGEALRRRAAEGSKVRRRRPRR